jgi:hypothetical protein
MRNLKKRLRMVSYSEALDGTFCRPNGNSWAMWRWGTAFEAYRIFRVWLGDFDPCFAAQTIDAEADFASDLAGVGPPDIEPVIEMEI